MLIGAAAASMARPASMGARLEPTRIEHLGGADLRHAYFLFRSGPSDGCAEC
jgi:hypothetical protein